MMVKGGCKIKCMPVAEAGTGLLKRFSSQEKVIKCLFHFQVLYYFLGRLPKKCQTTFLKPEFLHAGGIYHSWDGVGNADCYRFHPFDGIKNNF